MLIVNWLVAKHRQSGGVGSDRWIFHSNKVNYSSETAVLTNSSEDMMGCERRWSRRDRGFNNKQQGDTDRLTSPKVKENNEEERQEVSLLIVIFTLGLQPVPETLISIGETAVFSIQPVSSDKCECEFINLNILSAARPLELIFKMHWSGRINRKQRGGSFCAKWSVDNILHTVAVWEADTFAI